MSRFAIGMSKAIAVIAVLMGLVPWRCVGGDVRPFEHSERPASVVPDLFQVILEVSDMERQVAFYRDILGLPLSHPRETTDLSGQTFVRFDTPGASLALHERSEGGPQSAPARLSFMLPDVVGHRKELLAQGVEMGPIRSPAPGVLVTDGRDPEGNVFHLETRVEAESATGDVAAEARVALEAWLRAYDARDWQAFVGFYAEDARFHLHEQGRALYTSKDQVEAAIAGFYESIEEASFTVQEPEVVAVSDSLALVTAPYEQRLSLAGGTELTLSGTMHLLMVRGADGWRVLAGDTVARE